MKNNLLSFLLMTFLSSHLIAATVLIPASDTLIEYSGRIDFTNPDAPRFSYSGVSIRACFEGTAISAILNDLNGENYYNVILDKSNIVKLQPTAGQHTYILAENLADTIHEIEIFKLTEEMFGKTSFLGFQLDSEDSLVEISDKRELLIEFIGNSITCGYGNEGRNGGTFGASTENHFMTYAAITSRSFNARHLAVCKSGIGIYRNYDGPAEGDTDCMTNYYNRVYLYDEFPKYSFSETPDLVCINLGTNDFSTTGGDSALFVGTYLNFIDSIQRHYDHPDILCLVGSMLGGVTLENVRRYVQFVADSSNRKGMGNVYFFEMSEQTGDHGIGIDYHPTVAQHMENSRELINHIANLKGWSVHPCILRADIYATTGIKVQFNTGIYAPDDYFEGFSVYAEGTQLDIDTIYKDPVDSFAIHIKLLDIISIGDTVTVSYEQQGITGTGALFLPSFQTPVTNTLRNTTLSSGKVNSNGISISLVFNKTLQTPEYLEDLMIERTSGIIEVDSFSVTGSTLKLFTADVIYKDELISASYSGSILNAQDGIAADHFIGFELTNQSVQQNTTIDNQPVNGLISFYPNPVKDGTLSYKISDFVPGVSASISIIDLNGKTVLKQPVTKSEGKLLLGKKQSGTALYIVILRVDNKEYSTTIEY